MSRTYEHFREDLSDEEIERLKISQDEYYRQLIEQDDLIKESSEEELFLQILDDEREESLDPDFKDKLKKQIENDNRDTEKRDK